MKIYRRQFQPNEAWLVFRVDCYVQNQPVDIYILMDAASAYVFGQVVALSELPEDTEVTEILRTAYETKQQWPKRLFFQSPDPAEALFRAHADTLGIPFQPVAIADLEVVVGPFKHSFSQFTFSPLSIAGGVDLEVNAMEEHRMTEAFMPDSYDLCTCGSGVKYKFCCKPIFQEITHAMSAAQEGRFKAAIEWMGKAREIAGETPEDPVPRKNLREFIYENPAVPAEVKQTPTTH